MNFGFWDVVETARAYEPGHFNRLVEREVMRLGGIKSLYSDSYFTPEEFAQAYGMVALSGAEGQVRPGRAHAGLVRKMRAARVSQMGRLTMDIDVCNGDADGLCSVVQWRLHEPQAARLITGLKRDIELLERVQAGPGDKLLVCDLSMRRNRPALMRLLEAGVSVRYFDHHKVDEIPVHPLLEAHIDVASNICTSLLVDRYLGGQISGMGRGGCFWGQSDRRGRRSGRGAGLVF